MITMISIPPHNFHDIQTHDMPFLTATVPVPGSNRIWSEGSENSGLGYLSPRLWGRLALLKTKWIVHQRICQALRKMNFMSFMNCAHFLK
jgi:hypothetical protein